MCQEQGQLEVQGRPRQGQRPYPLNCSCKGHHPAGHLTDYSKPAQGPATTCAAAANQVNTPETNRDPVS